MVLEVLHLLVQLVQVVLKVLEVQLVQMVQQERKVQEVLLVPQVLLQVLVQTLQFKHLILYSRRHVSPTETERLLGFPTDWTNPAAASTDEQSHATSTDDHTVANQRRNAVGNAFAVPVIRRILQALMVAHWSTSSQGMGMWQDKELAAPYHPDILDDILPQAQRMAEEFQDQTEEFDLFLPKEWSRKLVGADPGAGGRKNRSERAAAVGIQQGTHLSRNGLEMLIPMGLTSPLDHVVVAAEAEHAFTKPVNIPLDLQFAAQRSALDPQAADADGKICRD